MKNILINLSNIKVGGGVQVALTLLEELTSYAKKNKIHVILSEELYNKDFNKADNIVYIKSKKNILLNLFFLNLCENKFKSDIVFSLFGPGLWRPKAKHISGFAIPHLIYPDSPFFDKKSLSLCLRLLFQKRMFKRNVDKFIVESDNSKLRLSTFLGIAQNKIFVVSNTYNQKFDNFSYKYKVQSNEYKVFCPTSYYPHKNLEILKEIDKKINDSNQNIKVYTTIKKVVFNNIFINCNNIINLGPININTLTMKYSEMDLVLSTSLLECFSANYIEAFKTKTPLLTTNLDFSTSICKKAAIYYECLDANDLFNKMVCIKSDSKLSRKLIDRGLQLLKKYETPKSRIKKYFSIINEE